LKETDSIEINGSHLYADKVNHTFYTLAASTSQQVNNNLG